MRRKLLKSSKKFGNVIKKHKIISISVLIIVILGIVFFFPKKQKQITTQRVTLTDFKQTIAASGKINAENIANLNFLTSGKITYLGAKEGDAVYAYQTIAILDQKTVQKNIESALNDYMKQRNTFEQNKDSDKNNILYQQQKISLESTAKNAVSGQVEDKYLNDLVKRLLENNQYDLNRAVYSVELQTFIQEQSVLTTPISGILISSGVKTTGVNISPTTTFIVADPNTMTFEMDIDEADIGNIKIGQKVQLELDAYPEKLIQLVIEKIDFATHKTSTGGDAFTVKARLLNDSSLKYKIGMNGNAEITTQEKKNVIAIPISSIVDDKFVYVKNKSEYNKVPVKIGLQNDAEYEIISGLKVGDEIVIDPTQILNGNK